MRNGWKAVGIKLNGIFNKNIYVMTDKEKAIALFSESIILQDKEAGAPINELTRCVNTAMINAFSVGYDAGFKDGDSNSYKTGLRILLEENNAKLLSELQKYLK